MTASRSAVARLRAWRAVAAGLAPAHARTWRLGRYASAAAVARPEASDDGSTARRTGRTNPSDDSHIIAHPTVSHPRVETLEEPAMLPLSSASGDDGVAAPPADDGLLESELDALVETNRTRFGQQKEEHPTRTDLDALRPPRMQAFVAGMSRPYYIDSFNKAVRRLSRSFTKPQLSRIVQDLGYASERSEDKGRRRTPGANLRQASKKSLSEWVATKHWGLTHPDAIPASHSLAELAGRQRLAEELVEIPDFELALLDAASASTSTPLHDLARQHNVTLRRAADSNGLVIKGSLADRDAFVAGVRRMRHPIVRRRLSPLPIMHQFPVTAELLDNLGSVAGCPIRGASFDDLTAHAYTEADLDRAQRALALFAVTQTIHSQMPLFLAPTDDAAAPITLMPFVPRSKPAWYISALARGYGRFTYPRAQQLPARSGFDSHSNGHSTKWACLRGNLADPLSWLLDLPAHPDLGDLRLRATFGHYVYPSQSIATAVGPKFSGDDAAIRLGLWNKSVIPPPAFVPAPQYDLPSTSTSPLETPAVTVDAAYSVRTYYPIDGKPDEDGALESIRVSSPRRGVQRVQRVTQRRAVLMLPNQALDLLLTAERRTKEADEDPSNGACVDDVLSFEHKGRTFVKMDQYTSQTVNLAPPQQVPPGVRLRHERRRDLLFPDRPTELRGELLAVGGGVSVTDFVSSAVRLVSVVPTP